MKRTNTMTKLASTLASTLALAGALSVTPAFAADEYNIVPGLTAVGAPLGMHGIDPVAFVRIGNRLVGSAEHTAVHDGVAFYFATEENKRLFEKAPQRYVPENGGFCTYGVSVGKKFDGNPRYAAVVDDKLYLFLNEQIFHLFNEDRAGTISKAANRWQKIRHTAASEL